MKKIVITGATGNIGSKLVRCLLQNPDYYVIAIVRNKENSSIKKQSRFDLIDIEELSNGRLKGEKVYCGIHLAFARISCSNEQIASSILFSRVFFEKISEAEIKKMIYVSSQGVYGDIQEIRYINMMPAPNSIYAMAKYSVEQMFNIFFSHMKYASILRLDNVVQSQRMPRALSNDIKIRGGMNLVGGNQYFSYIDIDDAVSAIEKLISCNHIWNSIYNVGLNESRYTLIQIAETLADIGKKYGYNASINLEQKDIKLYAGMNTIQFMNDTGWKPQLDIYQMLEKVFLEDQ